MMEDETGEVAGQDLEADKGALFASVPEVPDPPSYAPIITGLGIAVSAWGFLTDLTILGLGLLFFSVGMTIWIKELSYEP